MAELMLHYPLKNSISFHAESIFKIKNINKSNNYKNLILDIKRFFNRLFSRIWSPDKVNPICFDCSKGALWNIFYRVTDFLS